MSGNRRVVRTDRRPGCSQCSCNFRGGAHRCPVPGQRGIKADTEREDQLAVTWGSLPADCSEAHFSVGVSGAMIWWLRSTACSSRFSMTSGCSRMINEQIPVSSKSGMD